jgi:transglutaminase-like putative cysteine protease
MSIGQFPIAKPQIPNKLQILKYNKQKIWNLGLVGFLLFGFWNLGFADDYLEGASVIFEKDIGKIFIDKDFSRKMEKDVSILILNYRGRERFGNLQERYDKESEEIKIIEAKTIKKTGEAIEPEKKGIGDLSTVEKFIAPKYSNSRLKSIAFSAVEESARIVYKSTKTVREKSKYIFGSKIFQKNEPVLYSELSLKVPDKIKFHTIGDVKVTEKKEGDYFYYTFSVDSLFRISEEPSRIPMSEISPRVYYSNFTDWQEVWNWLKKDFYPSITVKGKLVNKAKEMAAGKNKEAVVKEIYDYVTKNWWDIPLTIQDAGFKPFKADEVYNQKYADNKDKCLLLITMLKAVGIDAYPGYVAKEIINDLPSPVYFYYMTVVLESKGNYIFLDPTFPERTSVGVYFPTILVGYNDEFPVTPDLTGREVFVVKPDTFLFISIPYPKPKETLSDNYYTFDIDQNGNIKGVMNGSFAGISAVYLRADYKDKTEKEQENELKGVISSIKTGTKLLNWKIENLRELELPVKVSLGFEAEKYTSIQGKRMQIGLLPYLFFPDFTDDFTVKERKYILDMKLPSSYIYQLEFRMPEGYHILHKPGNFEYNDSLITLRATAAFENNMVMVNREIHINQRRYSPENYYLMKEKWGDFTKPEMGFFIIEKK